MKRHVYFADRDGLIKIGSSTRPYERLDEIGARLITSLVGTHHLETGLHHMLQRDRVGVEWFQPTADVWEIIDLVVHGYHDTVRRMVAEFLEPASEARKAVEHAVRLRATRRNSRYRRKTTPYLSLIASERAAGATYRAIAQRLHRDHGLDVSYESVRKAFLAERAS